MNFITIKIDIKKFKDVSPPESISRARRLLYKEIKEGKHPSLKYLIDTNTEIERIKEEERYKSYFQEKNISKQAEVIK